MSMRDAYASSDHATERERRRKRGMAATFQPNEGMEQMVRLRDRDPAGYERLSPLLKMQLAYYLRGKEAAAEEGNA